MTNEASEPRPVGRWWPWVALAAVMVIGAALRFSNLSAIGESNTYYTAAVKGMLQSWSNFYFAAAEPGGSVTVDKPPVGLWLETASAALLGVSGFAVVLPNLLAGLGSILVLFHLIRRSFGDWPAVLAALVLALTPVSIAVERNNTPDGILVFTLLLAAWAFLKAAETDRLRWLLVGATLVGIGFNVKMLQAYLPLPAFFAAYLFGSQSGWTRRLLKLAAATVVLLVVSLSWAISVDLTPASQRPYVGGSTTNSEIELIVGYNGIERLIGGPGRAGGGAIPRAPGSQQPGFAERPPQGDALPPAGGGPFMGGRQDGGFMGGGPGGGGAFGTGSAGPLRLFQSGLAAQVSWLLPFGVIALGALIWALWRGRAPSTESRPMAVRHAVWLWGGWLLTGAAFFSVAQFFHQYYLTMLGAPLAAVVAIGFWLLWSWRASDASRFIAVLGIAAFVTLLFQAYAVSMYGKFGIWLVAPLALAAVGTVVATSGARSANARRVASGVAAVAIALLIVPGVWSTLTMLYVTENGGLPQAFGSVVDPAFAGQAPRNDTAAAAPPRVFKPNMREANPALLTYLLANSRDVKYLLVVPSSQQGAGYVLATGRPVLYAGGFSGNDPVLNAAGLAERVAAGDARFVLWGGGLGRAGGQAESDITLYLEAQCQVVDPATWGGTGLTNAGPGEAGKLYRCGP